MANISNNVAILKALQDRIGSADWSKWGINRFTFYDYIRYPTVGTNQMVFFAVPQGGTDANSGAAKTLEETNLQKSRTFGQVYYVIQQIRTHISVLPKNRQPAAIANDANVITSTFTALANVLYNLFNQGALFIKFGQKDYFQVPQPFRMAPPGMGIEIDQHASSAQATIWSYQSPDPTDIFKVEPAQLVEPEQVIDAVINFDNVNSPSLASLVNEATPNVNIGLMFDGYLIRPVQ